MSNNERVLTLDIETDKLYEIATDATFATDLNFANKVSINDYEATNGSITMALNTGSSSNRLYMKTPYLFILNPTESPVTNMNGIDVSYTHDNVSNSTFLNIAFDKEKFATAPNDFYIMINNTRINSYDTFQTFDLNGTFLSGTASFKIPNNFEGQPFQLYIISTITTTGGEIIELNIS